MFVQLCKIGVILIVNNVQVSDIIKRTCKEQNLSISSLLADCGLSKSFIYDLEKRNSSPSCDKIEAIADFFNCSVDYLLGRTTIKEINIPTPSNTQFLSLSEPLIRPMVGVAAAGKPLTMTVGCYDMIKINAVSDIHKKISPQDFAVEIHGDSMVDADIYNGDYAIIHPCPMVENGEIALVAVGDDCTLKKFYRTDGGVELHPCNPAHPIQKYKRPSDVRIIGTFICTCKGDIIEQY